MKQIMKYDTFCPLFPGFYNTVFEYSGEEDDINQYNKDNNTDLDYSGFTWDYREYESRVGKSFVTRVELELKQFIPITIEFQEIVSPKEYNFTNDSINISVELDLDQLIAIIKERSKEAAVYFKERYTTVSGFISFHSNCLEKWLNKDYILEAPEHRVGSLLNCLCEIEINQDDIIYWADGETGYINFEPIEAE